MLPAFVYRWLRNRSGSGHIRNTENVNRRVQDGLKFPWLCDVCEARFSRFETLFAKNVFYPSLSGKSPIAYQDWLLKFCVSISWRVLKFARGKNKATRYSPEQEALMDKAEATWRAFLSDEAAHPGEFEQQLLIFDIIASTNISDLPANSNRFMTGVVTLDIVGSRRSLMTFAKLGRFMIFGIIQRGPTKWSGTKVHLKNGILASGNISIPAGLLDMFKEKAALVAESANTISSAQKAKIDDHISNNLDAFAVSEQFAAMKADADMFGVQSVLWKDKT